MASINIISCDGCGNVILPGDVIALITKGFLVGTSDGSIDIQEVEESQPVHFCDSCATETAQTMKQNAEDSANLDLALAEMAGPGCCIEACDTEAEDEPVPFEDLMGDRP